MKNKGFQFKKQIKSLASWKYIIVQAPENVLLELFEVVEEKLTSEQF